MSETTQELTLATTTQQLAKPETRIVHDDSEIGYLMDTARFEQAQRIAKAMSVAPLMPQHLRNGTPQEAMANCFLVVNQALRWDLDPFSVAPCTYSIGGKLAYEGKLVAGVINSRAPLATRLSYTFSGQGDDLTVTVSATLKGEDEPRTVTLSVKQAKTSNKMWTQDPEQKLCYSGAIRWARRHCPEVLLGVFVREELDDEPKLAIAREVLASTLKFEEGEE